MNPPGMHQSDTVPAPQGRPAAPKLPPRALAATLLLGFSSGFPLALTGDVLAQMVTERGLTLAAVGAFAAVGTPYLFKFVWSPLVDALPVPGLTGLLGRRRAWIVVSLAFLAAAILATGAAHGAESVLPLAVAATALAFAGATQDIVIDAWRSERFENGAAAAAASAHVTGYRIGMIATGAGVLVLRGAGLPWEALFALAAACCLVGAIGVAVADERAAPPAPGGVAGVVRPFAEMLVRPDAAWMLLFVALFKLPDVAANLMAMPFFRQAGFDLAEVGAIRGGFGVACTIAGTIVGGLIAARVGLRSALWIYGTLQAVSNVAYLFLALHGPGWTALTAAVAVESFCTGLVTAGFLGFIQSRCSPGLAATQFALLTSLAALPSRLGGGPAGEMAEALGWPAFFGWSVALGLPGMALLVVLSRRGRGSLGDAPAPVPEGASAV